MLSRSHLFARTLISVTICFNSIEKGQFAPSGGTIAHVSDNCNLNIFKFSTAYTSTYFNFPEEPTWAASILNYFRENITRKREARDHLVAGTKKLLMMLYATDLERTNLTLSLKTDAINAFDSICTPKHASKTWHQLRHWSIASTGNATEIEEHAVFIIEYILRRGGHIIGLNFDLCVKISKQLKGTSYASDNCNLNIFNPSTAYASTYFNFPEEPTWAAPILNYFREHTTKVKKRREARDHLVAGTKKLLMMLYAIDFERTNLTSNLKTDAINAFDSICTPKNAKKTWYQLCHWSIASTTGSATEIEEHAMFIIENILRSRGGNIGMNFEMCTEISKQRSRRNIGLG